MGQARNWTKEEKEYLCEAWGTTSIPNIAKKLNRSVNAITVMKNRLGLGAFLESGDYITLHQLIIAVTGNDSGSGYKIKSWIENREFPVHTKKVGKCSYKIVYIKEFWAWAEKNRSFIDFSKMEPLILGEEPEWVAEQRKKDFESNALQRKDPWTIAEEERLKYLLSLQKYSYAEVSAILGRTEGAIGRRCRDLGIKARPIKADTHGASAEWTDEMYVLLAEGIKNGDSYALISRKIGKSEKSVRGKVYTKYLTEDADKVRAMIRGGEWGNGAPEPRVKQAMYLSHTKRECKEILSRLVGILKYRMNDMGYEPYWQRHMCMKWDSFKGCTAGCANCDECIEFERIKPQYCARCGRAFYERAKNRFCGQCRTARKKKAQRHWAMSNARSV